MVWRALLEELEGLNVTISHFCKFSFRTFSLELSIIDSCAFIESEPVAKVHVYIQNVL